MARRLESSSATQKFLMKLGIIDDPLQKKPVQKYFQLEQ